MKKLINTIIFMSPLYFGLRIYKMYTGTHLNDNLTFWIIAFCLYTAAIGYLFFKRWKKIGGHLKIKKFKQNKNKKVQYSLDIEF